MREKETQLKKKKTKPGRIQRVSMLLLGHQSLFQVFFHLFTLPQEQSKSDAALISFMVGNQ